MSTVAPALKPKVDAVTFESLLRKLVEQGTRRVFANGRFYDVTVHEVPEQQRQ